jgi:tRNA modification GTPase
MYSGDNEKYLNTNFNGGYSSFGTPFFDKRNMREPDSHNNKVLVVYGQNAASGQMFAGLTNLIGNVNNARAAATLNVSTLYQSNSYKVIAVVLTDENAQGDLYFDTRRTQFATNGEFTKRAFMNGKLSLSSAEGLIDMINSESVSGVKAGYYLYRENLTKEINALQDIITDTLAQIDCDMDFPEEDLERSSTDKVVADLKTVIERIDALIKTYRTGRTLKNGVSVAIVGKPNTGKSSILNALLSYEKAIVSDIAGTTRDVVEGSLEINGVRFNFSDTAGIRESGDKIETLGVGLSKKILNESDLILFVLDGGDITDDDQEIYQLVKDKNLIVAVNKTDKYSATFDKADIYVSALKNDNIEQLKQLMFDKSVGGGVDLNGDFLCEERHYQALIRAKEKLSSALSAVSLVSLDLLSIDIKDGWDALGEISGRTATEDIISTIFAKFCVGK